MFGKPSWTATISTTVKKLTKVTRSPKNKNLRVQEIRNLVPPGKVTRQSMAIWELEILPSFQRVGNNWSCFTLRNLSN